MSPIRLAVFMPGSSLMVVRSARYPLRQERVEDGRRTD